MKKYFIYGLLLWIPGFIGMQDSGAVTPSQNEFAAAMQVFDQRFSRTSEIPDRSYMKILAQDVPESISRGISWRGTPYQIGDKVYSHGIAFNSSKALLIHLGKSAERFTAEVGLENNDNTRQGAVSGQGSVTFQVEVNGESVFQTPVMRLKDAAISVNAALKNAGEFVIRVGDGGDGRGWDQALWGDAVVWFPDNSCLRLQDIPWEEDLHYNPYVVSMKYDEIFSDELFPKWNRKIYGAESEEPASLRAFEFIDPKTQLSVYVDGKLYKDFPALELISYLENRGQADTPILDSIRILDTLIPVAGTGQPKLHWAKGAVASFDDFAPQEENLSVGKPRHFQPEGGRSSNQVMPFFNLEGGNGGVIFAIGWSGEWAMDFTLQKNGSVKVQCGIAKTHLRLHPEEKIRTPKLVLLFYQGDRWRGQNLFRQFVLQHYRPTKNHQPLVAPITCGNWGGTSAAIHLDNINKIIQQDLPIEYYWIDAEWYGKSGREGGWPINVGSWQVKKDLYPDGFKPLSDALRKSGRELMLWFEPERVFKNTVWWNEHPEWLLKRGGDNALFNLANPAARQYLSEFIGNKLDEFGLGCYRQDFNIDPLSFWQAADAPDRVGMTEIRYIEGLYAYWDSLLSKKSEYPDGQLHDNALIIDNCASGGRRIDLETLKRSVPYWRTDGPRDPIAHQCHTYGLLPWVPLSSTSEDRAPDDYEFRSSMCSALCLNWWVSGDVPAERIPDNFPFAWAKKTLQQYLDLRKYYYGDYYPLTSYSQAKDVWMAYQLDRPDLGEGLVVILKRPQSPYTTARFCLKELKADAVYEYTNLDTGKHATLSGKEMMTGEFAVMLVSRPDSALIQYRIKK